MPVVAQIVLPLAMLVFWLGIKIVQNLFGQRHNATEHIDSLSGSSFEKTA